MGGGPVDDSWAGVHISFTCEVSRVSPDLRTVRRVGDTGFAAVRSGLLRLGSDVTSSIPRCTSALLVGDEAAAQRIIDGDDSLDALAHDIEDHCYGS